MADCVFCRIIAGEIPASIVYSDDAVVAFRDIAPQAPTHVLLVPREHIESVQHVQPEHGPLLASLVSVANRIAAVEGISQTGFRLLANVGPNAGLTVNHLHVHLLGGAPLGPLATAHH